MTWWRDRENPEDFSVFFNRDESKKRAIAEPPQVFGMQFGVWYIAPIDPEAGGTWLTVNEFGVVVALLNWYDKDSNYSKSRVGFESRGLLVKNLANASSLEFLRLRIDPNGFMEYRPFHLLAISTEGGAAWSWGGWGTKLISHNEKIFSESTGLVYEQTGLVREETGLVREETLFDRGGPISSSSFETEAVLDFRRELFAESEPETAEDFENFHNNFGKPSTAFTPRMNRPDAQTWSRSRIDVRGGEVSFRYVEEFLDHAEPAREVLPPPTLCRRL